MYLVTGGAGFIGSHIALTLAGHGERVRVFDVVPPKAATLAAAGNASIEWRQGDLRDEAAVRAACEGVEVVFHEAAIASVPASIADPIGSHAVNDTGTVGLLRAAKDAGARRLVFASSAAIYGNNPVTPKHEGMLPQPLSPYAAQKLSDEHYLKVWHEVYGLETVALRYFNVFGPRQDPTSAYAAAVPIFTTKALRGEPIVIYGDGGQSRDFVYVGDVVAANLLAAEKSEAVGKVINIGTGAPTTVNQVVSELERIFGHTLDVRREAPRLGDIYESLSDISRAREVLGYAPATAFAQGLAETVKSYQAGM